MIAEATRRSPLADYADRFTAIHEATSGAISIRELPFLTQINLRADPADGEVMGQLVEALGLDLPRTPNSVATTRDRRALWLGPNEWLIVAAADQAKVIEDTWRGAMVGSTASWMSRQIGRCCLSRENVHRSYSRTGSQSTCIGAASLLVVAPKPCWRKPRSS